MNDCRRSLFFCLHNQIFNRAY